MPRPAPRSLPDPRSDPITAHERLLAALARRLAADTGADPVVVRTHISSLVLAGDTVIKLKRPVRLPFLDFSTTARRRHFCEEELRLNRRTAPDLYRDVVPLTGTPEAPRLGGDGPVLDWALRMRRFDPAGEFAARARAGVLDAADIDALAAHVAHFHAALPAVPPAQQPRSGPREAAAAALDAIGAHPARPGDVDTAAVAATRTRLAAAFAAQAERLARRAAAGWVREGHGDLHLGNIVRWQGQVMAFDALEFDASLRTIDVVADVAFVFMDLLAHGLPGLAWRFIGGWAEQTGDVDGLALLRPLAAYRALVRAQVALLCGNPAAFARYWPLAVQLAAPPPTPRLVLVMGLSGAGKSTVAAWLAEALGAVRIRSDVERKRLAGLAPTARVAPGSDPAAQLYGTEMTQRTYGRLNQLAGDLLAAGVSVVVDAAALRQAEREALRATAGRAHAAFDLVDCQAPAAQMRSRIAERAVAGTDPSDATAAVLERQTAFAEPLPPGWDAITHRLVNDADLAALQSRVQALAEVLAWTLKDSGKQSKLSPFDAW